MRYLFIVAFFIIGCSVKSPYKQPDISEDKYIIKALVYESQNEYNKSMPIYNYLYKKTKNPAYYEKIIEGLFREEKFDEVIKKAEKFNKKHFNKKIFQYEIFALLEKGEYEKAKELLQKRFNKKDEFYYMMMSYILIKQGKLDKAVSYLKSLYALNHSKNVLLQLSDVLIKLRKYNEALAYLRTHLDLYGCEYDVCQRLAFIYKQMYDFENLAVIYEKLGEFDRKYYIYALNIYLQLRNYDEAIRLVKKYNLNKEYLMLIYAEMKKYRKAAEIAYELYSKTSNLNYLLKYCQYLYQDHPTKEELVDIAKKLEYLAPFYQRADIYNFLGYLLINNDIDYKKGLEYVQKALEKNPQNIEYIDSLAWGYYKLKKCKKAWEIIKYIKTNDKEILKHKKLIKECLNDSSKNNK